METKTNILITGNTGYVGKHLVKHLTNQYLHDMGGSYPAYNIFYSNTQTNNLLYPINPDTIPVKLDKIYHLATYIKAGTFPKEHQADIWEQNQLINSHIISYWIRHQPQATFVGIGTSCAYPLGIPLVEKNYLYGPTDPDVHGYAVAKRMMLHGLMCAAQQYGLKFQYFIPGTLNGPLFGDRETHFNFDFIRKIWRGVKNNEPVVFWGNGSQGRQIVDIDDFIKILLSCPITNRSINISNGRDCPIIEYVKIIANELKYDFYKIKWDTTKWVGNTSKILVNTQLKDYRFMSEEDSLRRTAQWYTTQVVK